MKSLLWLLTGIVVGAFGGWYLHSSLREARPAARFAFIDRLAEQHAAYLLAAGTLRGSDLANKINTVRIFCDGTRMTCEMTQADVMSLGWEPSLSLFSNTFRITRLDAQSVLAEPAGLELCIRQTLTFDRVAKAVTFTRTKINHEEACSLVQEAFITLILGEPP
jgi:hypothetical protein